MVTCACGKTIEKIPDWMDGIKVSFVCNNCPNRQTKNIAFIDLDAGLHSSAKVDDEPKIDEEPDDDEE
jgi:hypothetical protein